MFFFNIWASGPDALPNHRRGLREGVILSLGGAQASRILRVECAESFRDRWSDPDDAILQAWSKHCDPKVAANNQLRAAQCGRTLRIGRAIKLHLLGCRCCMIHGASSMRRGTVFIHLSL